MNDNEFRWIVVDKLPEIGSPDCIYVLKNEGRYDLFYYQRDWNELKYDNPYCQIKSDELPFDKTEKFDALIDQINTYKCSYDEALCTARTLGLEDEFRHYCNFRITLRRV